MRNIAMNLNTNFEHGIITCICETYNKFKFLLGTSSGYLLEYDLRFNSILNQKVYSENIPIIGITKYDNNPKNQLHEIHQIYK